MALIDSLIQERWLKTPRIIEAFRKIKREDFMPLDMRDLAENNEAFPIGYGQTISQPLTVAFMLEHLQPEPGDKILDIGAGSGWTSALLAEIVAEKGKVIAIEIVPELKEFGEKNISKYNFIKKGIVEFICVDGSQGYEKEAPYDKILASASVHPHTITRTGAESAKKQSKSSFGVGARKLPQAWKEQLKINGRIVAPITSSIWLFIKKSENKFEEREFPGFAFVPLVSK